MKSKRMSFGRLEVFLFNLADVSLFAPAELSTQERERAERFGSPVLARRYVALRVALRRLLAERLGIDNSLVFLKAAVTGKPAVERRSKEIELQFSIARSGDRGLIALATGREVGVDIELPNPSFRNPELQRLVLAPDEMRSIDGLVPSAREEAVARCWVRKEAVLKALGIGLSYPLRGFAVYAGESARTGLTSLRGSADTREVTWQDVSLPGEPSAAALAFCESQ